METTVPVLIGLTTVVLLCLGAVLDDRRARFRRRVQREEHEAAVPLLHSINDDRCIGCEACIDVCPTEVLDLVDHKVRVARFSDCVQCEQCANACPTQALVMYREGTTPRMLTVPELDEQFQTGVPGQYLIGEVAGKPLVKNAANLGRAVIEHIARDLARGPAHGAGAGRGDGVAEVLDVLIVGSGPGGLSAGLACIKHELACLVLEKEHVLASTVSRYPKGKHFMAEPCTSQNVSYLPVFDATKEELVAAWQQVVEGARLPVRLGEAVETVSRGDDGVFTVKSTVGTYRARTVVLATGLRGKPRLLAVPGANLEKVQSLLDDPAEFAGEAVLVVGGGDSAVEGAMSLADAGATVTLSYRGDGFKRCKQGNQKRLAEMVASQRLTVLLESNVKQFTPGDVTITLADKTETTIPNQRAFVLIGADTPVAWLEANHVRFVERPHLYALGSTEDAVRRIAPDAAECPRTPEEALAIVLGRPWPQPAGRRMRSVVGQLRDELREVVTSVSAAFRLSDLEPPREARRAATRPPTRGGASVRTGSNIIPASRLATGRPATAPAAPGGAIRPGLFGQEQTTIGPAPMLPRAARRRAGSIVTGDATRPLPAIGDRTEEVPSLRALERSSGADAPGSARSPQPPPPYDFEDSVVTELPSLTTVAEVPSRRTISRTTVAEELSLRAVDGSLDTIAAGRAEHPWMKNAGEAPGNDHNEGQARSRARAAAPERRTPSVVTSAIRPSAMQMHAPPPPPPRPPARLARGSAPPPHRPPPPLPLARGSAPPPHRPAPPPPPPAMPRSARAAEGSGTTVQRAGALPGTLR